MKRFVKAIATCAAFAATSALSFPAAAKDPYNIYLSMSYIGNDWQAESSNMIRALAAHKDYKDKVNLRVQVSGPSASKQIQQINAMVQAGANAIIMYAVSGTLLNQAIKNACDKGVLVFTYDSPVTEPCAHNISADNTEIATTGAEWLAGQLNGKGNIVMVTGVPGTSVDEERNAAAEKVFAKHPDIKVVARISGMWSQAITRSELSKLLATHPWEDIDGLWMQTACYQAAALQDEAGIADDKKKPCAGGGDNGQRIQLLPAGTEVEGADGVYRPMGYPGISLDSPVYQAALALKHAVSALDGGATDLPKKITVPVSRAETGNVTLCKTGNWDEMKEGCNVFAPAIVTNPGWFAGIYSEEIPEVGLNAALVGQPEE